MEQPTAWIITVGNEILIGRIVNTNASWLARRLTLLGFRVERIVTVPDSIDDIAEEVGRAVSRAKVTITTGGLGPTYDDMTLEGVAKAVGRRLTLNRKALDMIRDFYSKRGLPITDDRKKMAMLPEGAEPIPNPVGAAPGSLLRVEDKLIVSLPGVPAEMEEMFKAYVEPILREIAPERHIVECSLIVQGVPESSLAPALKKAAKKYSGVYLKSHPKGHETLGPILDVRALASAGSREEAETLAKRVLEEIEEAAKSIGGKTGEINCN